MQNAIPSETSVVLLAWPEGARHGEWLGRWQDLIAAWQGGWDISSREPGGIHTWRRRALEQGGRRWVLLADGGCAPGAVALFQALQVMAMRPKVACVGLVPPGSIAFLPELRRSSPFLWSAPFASGGVVLVKGSAVSHVGLPDPRFYPYDLAEMTFRMTCNGMEVLLLVDPSFLGPPPVGSLFRRCRQAWQEGRGGAAFRVAHRGRAPRSLRLPRSPVELFLVSPWLVASSAWRYAKRAQGLEGRAAAVKRSGAYRAQSPTGLGVVRTLVRALGSLPESAAFVAGATSGYKRR